MSENDNENSRMNNFDPITGEQINPDYKGWDSVAAESNENKTYESYDTSGEPEFAEQGNNNAPTKKRWGIGKKLGFAAAIAAVCGLVGGSVFYGVNFLGNTVFYNTKAAVESEASAEASSDALAVIEAADLESVAGNVELSRADYTSSTTAYWTRLICR